MMKPRRLWMVDDINMQDNCVDLTVKWMEYSALFSLDQHTIKNKLVSNKKTWQKNRREIKYKT